MVGRHPANDRPVMNTTARRFVAVISSAAPAITRVRAARNPSTSRPSEPCEERPRQTGPQRSATSRGGGDDPRDRLGGDKLWLTMLSPLPRQLVPVQVGLVRCLLHSQNVGTAVSMQQSGSPSQDRSHACRIGLGFVAADWAGCADTVQGEQLGGVNESYPFRECRKGLGAIL